MSEEKENELLDCFVARLNKIKNSAPEKHALVEKQLTVLYKYRIVRALRTKQIQRLLSPTVNSSEIKNTNIFEKLSKIQLQALEEWDNAIKQAVYSQKIDILNSRNREQLGSVLSHSALNVLLTTSTDDALLGMLDQAQNEFLSQLTAWRKNLVGAIKEVSQQSSWCQWLQENAFSMMRNIYRFSFLGVGIQAGQIIGTALGNHQAGQWIGGGLGVAFSYGTGSYGVFKTVVLGFFSMKLIKITSHYCINNQNATYNSPPFFLQPNYIPYGMNCLVSGMESFYLKQSYPLLRSLTTPLVSSLSIMLFNLIKFDVSNSEEMAKANIYRLTFILLGTQLGIILSSLLENAYVQVAMNKKFFNLAQEYLSLSNRCMLIVDPPNVWSSGFWLTRQQTARISWQCNTNPHIFYRTCELMQSDVNNNFATANCTQDIQGYFPLQ